MRQKDTRRDRGEQRFFTCQFFPAMPAKAGFAEVCLVHSLPCPVWWLLTLLPSHESSLQLGDIIGVEPFSAHTHSASLLHLIEVYTPSVTSPFQKIWSKKKTWGQSPTCFSHCKWWCHMSLNRPSPCSSWKCLTANHGCLFFKKKCTAGLLFMSVFILPFRSPSHTGRFLKKSPPRKVKFNHWHLSPRLIQHVWSCGSSGLAWRFHYRSFTFSCIWKRSGGSNKRESRHVSNSTEFPLPRMVTIVLLFHLIKLKQGHCEGKALMTQ